MDDWVRAGERDWMQIWLKQEQEIRADTRCSFCGKRRDQVSRLTAGPGKVYICDECVDLYREHLAQMDGPPTSREKSAQICTSCGIRAPVSHRYCYNCGSPFVEDSNDSENA